MEAAKASSLAISSEVASRSTASRSRSHSAASAGWHPCDGAAAGGVGGGERGERCCGAARPLARAFFLLFLPEPGALLGLGLMIGLGLGLGLAIGLGLALGFAIGLR